MQGILVTWHLGSKFHVKGYALPLFFPTHSFYCQRLFSQQLLEPEDIEVAHKQPKLSDSIFDQSLVCILP